MKPYALLLLSLVALTAGGIWVVARREANPPPPPLARPPGAEATARAPAHTAPVRANPDQAPSSRVATEDKPPAMPELIADPTRARERIQALVASFNPAHLEELAGYLAHPSRELRGAAMDGLVLFGDPEAAPFLRAAAEVAEKDPNLATEAVALREAADMLLQPRPAGEPRPEPASADQPSTKHKRR